MNGNQDRILEMARGFMPSRVLLTGVELNVFGTLGTGSLTSAEVAAAIKADERATDRLLNALVALEALRKEDGRFSVPEEMRVALVPGTPGFTGGGLMHTANLWTTWSTLTDAVKAGHSVYAREDRSGPEFAKPFIAAMHTNASIRAKQIISLLDLRKVRRVLDVGGGSGAYSIEMAKTKADIEAVVFDQPDVTPLTNKYVAAERMSDRISTVIGDFNKDALPGGFDLAFMSHILHSNGPDENAALMKNVWRALEPGGQVVIQEFVMDEGRTTPPFSALFALNMLVATSAGDTYTEREIAGWLTAAGFADVHRIDPEGLGATLILARKG